MVGTMGVALTVCSLPGQATSDRLGPEKMELGLGVVCCYILLTRRKETALIVGSVSIFDFLFFSCYLKLFFLAWGTWCCCGRHSTCGCCSLPCSSTDTESSMCIVPVSSFHN